MEIKEWHWGTMGSGGVFLGKQLLRDGRSRAQDAIKRLDCAARRRIRLKGLKK
jgi:hypothetical protein